MVASGYIIVDNVVLVNYGETIFEIYCARFKLHDPEQLTWGSSGGSIGVVRKVI